MSNVTVKAGLYDHFKGEKKALVFAVGKHSEAHHLRCVYYFEIDKDNAIVDVWHRPVDDFTTRIIRDLAKPGDTPKPYDGPRFWRIGTLDDGLKLVGCTLQELLDKLGASDAVEAKPVFEETAPEKKRIHDASMPGGGIHIA
jgi:hypothetical protein